MKRKCLHRFQLAGSVTTDLERVFTLRCNLCGREKTQKRKMPSRSHRNAPGSTAAKKKGGDKPRTRIKPVSDKQKARNAEYSKLRKAFLEERKVCQMPGCKKAPDDIHHKRGRKGKNLTDTSTWAALCREHHDYCHQNVSWARQQDWIQYDFS